MNKFSNGIFFIFLIVYFAQFEVRKRKCDGFIPILREKIYMYNLLVSGLVLMLIIYSSRSLRKCIRNAVEGEKVRTSRKSEKLGKNAEKQVKIKLSKKKMYVL